MVDRHGPDVPHHRRRPRADQDPRGQELQHLVHRGRSSRQRGRDAQGPCEGGMGDARVMRFLRGIKGVTLMEMLVATSLSGVLVMGAGSMAMMSDKMLKAIESDPSLDAFFGVERLSRAVSRARYITSSGTDVFKARLDYDFTNGIWRPRHTPSDPSDDTWIAAKWIPSMKAVYLAYPTGAGEPPDPTSAGIQIG